MYEAVSEDPSRYRAITAQAWAGMLALLLMMFIADLLRFSMQGEYREMAEALAVDPGPSGLRVLVVMVCFNTLLQLAVHTFDAPLFRKAVFWAGVLYTVFFLLHQVVHLIGGEALGVHTVLDLTHHVLGTWACWASWRWSRAG
jgi:hypothetical protein